MLWVLLASKITPATADEAGPVCPSAEPVRVACLGDSLTNGDAKFVGEPRVELGSRLGSDSVFSRGSYPRVLAGLLGPRFQVKAFAQSGMPLTDLLPSACVVPGNDEASPVEVVPHTAPSDNASATAAVARCHEALDLPTVLQAEVDKGRPRMVWRGDGRHPLLQEVVASRPHVVLLLLGTNDAGELSHTHTHARVRVMPQGRASVHSTTSNSASTGLPAQSCIQSASTGHAM